MKLRRLGGAAGLILQNGDALGLPDVDVQQRAPLGKGGPVQVLGEEPLLQKQAPGLLHQQALLLLAHGGQQDLGHFLHNGTEIPHRVGRTGDADDPLAVPVHIDGQVYPLLSARSLLSGGHLQHRKLLLQDFLGDGVQLTDPLGVGAGQNGTRAVHDVHIPADGFLDLLYDPHSVLFGQEHGARLLGFVFHIKILSYFWPKYKNGFAILRITKQNLKEEF